MHPVLREHTLKFAVPASLSAGQPEAVTNRTETTLCKLHYRSYCLLVLFFALFILHMVC